MPKAGAISLEGMVEAVEKVKRRLQQAVSALEAAHVPYAVAGGNAVAAWVSSVDQAAARNTQGVDVLIRRDDFAEARRALEGAGFTYRHVSSIDMFLDGPNASPRDAVHIIFAGELVRAHEATPNPDVSESQAVGGQTAFRVLSLEALVRTKLTAWRDKDRTHLRDLVGVGLVDATWPSRFTPELGARLQQLLDTPDG